VRGGAPRAKLSLKPSPPRARRRQTADDPNIYRELGYAYEVSKQYGKALSAYQKGAELSPDDEDFRSRSNASAVREISAGFRFQVSGYED
jgi:tetratricopeptide (TPR) repeat protein